MKLLEVIVTCAEEAEKAEQGGADRLEVVRDLHHEGLTPAVDVVEKILDCVSIPVRVMLREEVSFSAIADEDLRSLASRAAHLAQLPVSGFVLGFIRDAAVDTRSVQHIIEVTGGRPVTFHRAIEHVSDQIAAVEQLKSFPSIDRILVNGGPGSWRDKRAVLEDMQRRAAPQMTIIAGGGLNEHALRLFTESPFLNEFHVGRAAREGDGTVASARVAAVRRILDA